MAGWLGALAASVIVPSTARADVVSAPVDRPMGQGLELTAEIEPDTAVTCADAGTLFGIDVSKWQGEIDWAAVAADGVHYAIIRATHGTTIIDEWFDYNWEQAHAHGIIAGVYQYFEPAEDPIAQADVMLQMMGTLQPGDLPPVIDVESSTNSTPAQTAAAVGAWIEHVEAATGVKPIIYTGRYFWQDNVGTDAFADYPLWIAHYTSECPNIPDQWSDWVFHQYSSSGTVAGIVGAVDTNLFNGDLDDLMALTVQDVGIAGGVDASSCTGIEGWALPPGGGAAQVQVDFDGIATVVFDATLPHASACDAGGCEHGFSIPIPWSLHDGAPRTISVALTDGTPLGEPQSVTCTADLSSARLRPLSAAGLAAWRFDAALDVLVTEDAPPPSEDAFPDDALLVQGETIGGLWWIDTGVRRQVSDEAAAAWQLDSGAVLQWPDASLEDVPLGPSMPAQRHAVQVGGAQYVVDVAIEGGGSDDGGSADGGDSGDGGDPDAGGDGSDGGGDATTSDQMAAEGDETGGCGCRSGRTPSGLGFAGLWLWGLVAAAARRRRRQG